MQKVIDISSARSTTGNLSCEACGCQWLDLSVTITAATREIGSRMTYAKCHDCGQRVPIQGKVTTVEDHGVPVILGNLKPQKYWSDTYIPTDISACPHCGHEYTSPGAADACCGDWLLLGED